MKRAFDEAIADYQVMLRTGRCTECGHIVHLEVEEDGTNVLTCPACHKEFMASDDLTFFAADGPSDPSELEDEVLAGHEAILASQNDLLLTI
jgi:NAD-dependent SIR2 family protein deacetylase